MPSRGRANPRRGISVRTRWGWGPSASGKKVPACRANRRPSSSVRNAARNRRSGSAAAPIAAPGIRSSKSAPPTAAAQRPVRHRYASAAAAGSRGCTATSRSKRTRGSRPASTNSIACSAAASCRDRWCCSAASRASASPRCCFRLPPTWRARVGPVLYSSGEESEHQIKSRGERLSVGGRAAVSARRDLPRADPRGDRPHQAGAGHRRFHPDGLLAEVPVGAGQHRPGARGGDSAAVHGEGPERARRSSSGTSRRTAASPGPRRSSTWSTRCSTSKANAITRTASCARSRTASAPSASSACSR